MLLWVRVHTSEGHIGLGETYYGPATVEAAVHEQFAPILIGRDPSQIDRHWYNMFRISDHFGYGGAETRAISAIDTALWDIAGQTLERPIYELLGGACRDRIRAYDTGGGDDPVAYATESSARGITAMKLGVFPFKHLGDGYDITPGQVDKLITPVRLVAEALGDRMQIAVDGHGFWSVHAAGLIAKALEGYPILWLEEIASPRNVDAQLKFRQRTTLPICLAERFVTRYQFREFIERGAMDIAMPDLVWTGGISETRKVSSYAETYQMPVCPHDCTGPVNAFACAHICMNAPNAMLMETSRAFYDEWYPSLVTTNISVVDGCLLAPAGPGLGTQLRPEVLARPDAVIRESYETSGHPMGWLH
ncbi:MAG: mandelate racemase/muconate lactonizing enzyme family protein [Streptosporangiaceae bacterium]